MTGGALLQHNWIYQLPNNEIVHAVELEGENLFLLWPFNDFPVDKVNRDFVYIPKRTDIDPDRAYEVTTFGKVVNGPFVICSIYGIKDTGLIHDEPSGKIIWRQSAVTN